MERTIREVGITRKITRATCHVPRATCHVNRADASGVVRFVLTRVAILVGFDVIVGNRHQHVADTIGGTLLYGLEPCDPSL